MDVDYDKLRSDLIDYLGTATSYYPMIVIEIEEVQRASNESLLYYAKKYNFNLYNYVKGSNYRKYIL